MTSSAGAKTIKLVAFGDSLTAGFGLQPAEGFTAQLQEALQEKGHNVVVINAGVSGDTTSGGRSRMAWSVAPDTDAVILELGANDMLRGIPVSVVRDNLDFMVKTFRQNNVPLLLAGMRAAPNLGEVYTTAFDAIYPDLANRYGVLFYPFFLEGVAGSATLNQPDGLHPTTEGIALIVKRILPHVETLIGQVAQ